MSEGGAGGIFISYRRQESGHVAGRLSDRLIDRFGPERVFIDVETIEPGADFAEVIDRAVGGCAVLLAVIGPGWLRAADERGSRRLDDADDLVRLEIGAALARGVRVIPVLTEGALMPRRDELPENLAALTRRNALQVRHVSFRDDAGRLVAAVERALSASAAEAGAAPAATATPAATVTLATLAAPAAEDAWRRPGAAAAQNVAFRTGIVPTRKMLGRRFVIKAERLANSITAEPVRAAALANVAEAVAVTDVDRAERIAHSVSAGYPKARALSRVALAVAAADPGRAARLSAEAEQLAGGFFDEASRAWVLSCVAGAVALTDPNRAERIADAIPSPQAKVMALAAIAKAHNS